MSLVIFLIILSLLIIVHEMGHFLVARKFGIRVDEFGLGYPPKAKKLFRWRGTDFTLNWLPFGGFVKIFGENPSEEVQTYSENQGTNNIQPENQQSDNFQAKNRGIQAAVLSAGVFFNFVFAWLLISIGFMTGVPSPAGLNLPITNPQTVITTVVPDSPAALAGIKSGDTIIALEREKDGLSEAESTLSPEAASEFIGRAATPLVFKIKRGESVYNKIVTPKEGLVVDRPAVGIAMEVVGIVQLPVHQALWQGLKITLQLGLLTIQELGKLISQAIVGKADLSSVSGPIGIVSLVGEVRQLGLSYLMTFTAFLSINLAIINLIPFPALDGGRLLFVGIEAIRRKPMPARVFNILNTAGFALLIFLMILITVHDVRNIL